MKKIVIVFVAVFCINSLTFAQDVMVVHGDTNEKTETAQELKYFKEDNAFYLGGMRLSEYEVQQTLSSNPSALSLWERGNTAKKANTGMKIATGVLVGVGGVITIVSFTAAVTEAFATIGLFPLFILSGSNSNSSDRYTGWLIAGACLVSYGIVTGIMIPITKNISKACYLGAVDTYNKGLKSQSTVSLHIGVVEKGLGFSLKF